MAGLLVLIGIAAVVYAVYANFGPSDAQRMASRRMFIDATTGRPFAHTLSIGERIPVLAPSGKDTGYPAEACYWTKDGKTKSEPTWVLVNMWKGSREPTFCPDCGRLVVGHNPAPRPGMSPPPTQAEYYHRHGAAASVR